MEEADERTLTAPGQGTLNLNADLIARFSILRKQMGSIFTSAESVSWTLVILAILVAALQGRQIILQRKEDGLKEERIAYANARAEEAKKGAADANAEAEKAKAGAAAADARAAEAERKAAEANLMAAVADGKAADANLAAAELKLRAASLEKEATQARLELERMKARRLTEAQWAYIIQALAPYVGQKVDVTEMANAEVNQFNREIVSALTKANWQPQVIGLLMGADGMAPGIYISIVSSESPIYPAFRALCDALGKTGNVIHAIPWQGISPRELGNDTIGLMVGPKPAY